MYVIISEGFRQQKDVLIGEGEVRFICHVGNENEA